MLSTHKRKKLNRKKKKAMKLSKGDKRVAIKKLIKPSKNLLRKWKKWSKANRENI